MAELYDSPFNGGFSEFKFTGKVLVSAGENEWTNASLSDAGDTTVVALEKQISIIGVQWSINGGGLISIEEEDATEISASPILTLSGNGHFHTGSHGVSFSPIKLAKTKGIQLIGDTNETGYTVIIKIRKEEGFGFNNPR